MTITSVEAYISGGSGTLGIMNNVSGGKPSGTFISGDSSAITGGLVPVNLTSLNWSLAAGTYWLVAVADFGSIMRWQFEFGNPLGSQWASTSDGSGETGWVAGLPGSSPLALISGTATVSSTPLPAALPLFATGLGALGLLGWRRKRKLA
jgi:hypothetical protein